MGGPQDCSSPQGCMLLREKDSHPGSSAVALGLYLEGKDIGRSQLYCV